MKSILVTGDRGYIGSVLCEKLLQKGYKVTGIDTGFFEKNLVFPQKIKYKKITKDVRKINANDLTGIDAIIHLSALSNDPIGELNPKLTQEINHEATIRLARLAKKAGVGRFIFSSSCSIYGISKSGIVDEKTKPNPLTEYARSKIRSEKELGQLADKNFFVGLMRNSTVYGFSPRFRDDLVVNNLTSSALSYGELRIMSDGSPWRPLIDVSDLADIFIEFLNTQNEKLNGKVVNIGFSENNFRVKDLVNVISKNLPKCKIVYTGEHGKDSRSYRVKFNLFKKNFPHVRQKWTIDRSVKNIIKNLKKSNYKSAVFESGKYTRLSTLKKLLENKKINKNLYWI